MGVKKGYKVVRAVGAGETYYAGVREVTAKELTLVSATNGDNRVIYKVDEPAVPADNAGPLCVFTVKRQAVRFAAMMSSCFKQQVYRCDYIPSRKRSVWDIGRGHLKLGTIREDYPSTSLASEVVLRKRVIEVDCGTVKKTEER